MTTETILIALLAALVVILAVLLATRLRAEKSQSKAIRRMNLAEFADFLKSNSLDGTIQMVARKVSDLLIKTFDCNRIVFLRKKRGVLELNFYHGIRGFNRRDFRVPFSQKLAERLREGFFPRELEALGDLLPASVSAKISSNGMDRFFPVFWRDNLYGVYFIRRGHRSDEAAFGMLTALVAQSLSAAYHVKWHESKLNGLQKQMDKLNAQAEAVSANDQVPELTITRLLRHRNSQTIVPKIVESIRTDLGLQRVAYVYEQHDSQKTPAIAVAGTSAPMGTVPDEFFSETRRALNDRRPIKVDELEQRCQSLQGWVKTLRTYGLDWVACFPLTSQRRGVIAWAGEPNAAVIGERLKLFSRHTSDLIDNAQSYEAVEELSYTDGLTGLANQRYFHKRLREEVSRAARYKRNLALILFDLDELKITNDTYGHQAGDGILRQLGNILSKSIRTIDIIARYGGDEFCITMPEADESMCARFMERLQAHVARWEFTIDGVPQPIRCTVSLGGAVYPVHAKDAKGLIFAADMALLKAKESGRNKAFLYNG